MTTPPELAALRTQIDAIDQELWQLLARRFQVTAQVGQLKKEHQLAHRDGEREAAQLAALMTLADELNLDQSFVLRVQRLILDEVVHQHRLC